MYLGKLPFAISEVSSWGWWCCNGPDEVPVRSRPPHPAPRLAPVHPRKSRLGEEIRRYHELAVRGRNLTGEA